MKNIAQKSCACLLFMNWLRMLKDHVVSSFHIEMEDLDYTPFDAKGGRGKIGEEMDKVISELNEELVA